MFLTADAAELVDGGVAAKNRMIFHDHMSGQPGKSGHDDVIAQNAVVRDVYVGEEQIVGADDGGVAVVGGAVDGNGFAEDVVVANLEAGDSAFPFQVLSL